MVLENTSGNTFGIDIDANEITFKPNEIKKLKIVLGATNDTANFEIGNNVNAPPTTQRQLCSLIKLEM